MIPNDEREKRNAVCRECDIRKAYAKMFDVHFDWRDCLYDCPNDIEHLRKDGEHEEWHTIR